MGRALVLLCLSGVAMMAAPVSAATLELEPASEWRLRDYDDKCRMIRTFGDGEDAVTLWIEKAGAGRFINMTVIGRPFRSPYGTRVSLAFRPGDPISRGFIRSTSSKGRPVLTLFGVSAISHEPEPIAEGEEETVDLTATDADSLAPEILSRRYDEVEAIELSGALVQKVSLKSGGLGSMMVQLERCAETLPGKRPNVSSGEGDRAQGASARDVAVWAPQIQANYPAYLLREMAQGTVGVRVQINPEGRATFCEVREYTGPAGFNDAACLAMMRYSRFNPARDGDGNPVWGTYSTRVTYRIN